ncbi:hypothetical protein F4808DRAFT_462345 [Astrocystis sublimbata]|nr:hypothetical protein F4808DRAFT_462345 [Astrocystis sublimbata]
MAPPSPSVARLYSGCGSDRRDRDAVVLVISASLPAADATGYWQSSRFPYSSSLPLLILLCPGSSFDAGLLSAIVPSPPFLPLQYTRSLARTHARTHIPTHTVHATRLGLSLAFFLLSHPLFLPNSNNPIDLPDASPSRIQPLDPFESDNTFCAYYRVAFHLRPAAVSPPLEAHPSSSSSFVLSTILRATRDVLRDHFGLPAPRIVIFEASSVTYRSSVEALADFATLSWVRKIENSFVVVLFVRVAAASAAAVNTSSSPASTRSRLRYSPASRDSRDD